MNLYNALRMYNAYDPFNVQYSTTENDRSFLLVNEGTHYSTTIPLPGALREDIDVSVSGNSLRVQYKPEKENPYATPFSRTWRIKDMDIEQVTSKYENGLLTVTVNKRYAPTDSSVRKIQID